MVWWAEAGSRIQHTGNPASLDFLKILNLNLVSYLWVNSHFILCGNLSFNWHLCDSAESPVTEQSDQKFIIQPQTEHYWLRGII